jgi:hypothetical protein
MYVSFFALVQGPSILLPSKRLKAVPLNAGGFYSIEVVAAPTRPGLLNWVYDCLEDIHLSSLDRSGSQRKVLRKSIIAQIVQMAEGHAFDQIVPVRRGDIPGLCNGFAGGRKQLELPLLDTV